MSVLRALVVPAVTAAVLSAGLQTAAALPAASVESSELPTVRATARWTSVVDGEGNRWGPRTGFTGPANRSDRLQRQEIAGTEEDVLYQSSLFGATGFRTPVPTGSYRVRLLMAEGYHTTAGQRVFDVHAEGARVLHDVDIVHAVGPRHAYDRTFDVTVTDGHLDLAFVPRADQALISAIEVMPAPMAVPAPEEPAPSPSDEGADAAPMALGNDVSGGGLAPLVAGATVTASANAGDSRSEIWWGTEANGRFRLARHTTVTSEFEIWQSLSDPETGTAPSPKTWHTVFQLHGPTQAATWPGPPVTIAWQAGTFRVGGGVAVPDSAGNVTWQGSWYRPYLPAPERTWRKVTVQAYLDGPGRGWVSIWVDGRQYMDRWKPAAGTMYTDSGAYSHREINIKSGLYTGNTSPSWSRTVKQRNVKVTWTAPNADGPAVTAAAALR